MPVKASITDAAKDSLGGFQRGGDNLIHIVVAILSEAADKEDVGFTDGQRLVLLVQGFVLRARHGIVGIAGILRVFADDGGARVALAGEVFEFGDAGIGVVVGVVDYGNRLISGNSSQVLMLETKGAVGQGTMAIVEVGVDRSGVDDGFGFDLVANGEEVGTQLEADVGMIEHPLEHGRITILGHDLELVVKVAVVAVGADRNAGDDGGAELGGVEAPLFAGITPKEFFVKVAADGVEYDIFAGFDGAAGFSHPIEEGLNAGFVEVEAVEAVDGVLVDGDGEQLAVHPGADPMLVGQPVGEAGQVVDDALGVGVEDVRAVGVDENAVGVGFVEGVAADVGALVDDQHLLAGAGEAFGDRAAGEAGADDDYTG